MPHKTILILFTCFQCHLSFAQCDDYIVKGSQVFHANDIRTVINTGGDMFWDLNEARFQVPYIGPNTPSAIFAASVWIGGFDDVGNLKLAAQTYRDHRVEIQEYLPGPLTVVGLPFNQDCSNWDTIWTITREDIMLHIQDYADDGDIQNVQKAIYGWPGLGNPFFAEINGFDLPDYQQGYAPFRDIDQDGIYEPNDGEYPDLGIDHVYGEIADVMSWHVFNDARIHMQTTGDPLKMEIQQTTYAFSCAASSILNTTIFTHFRLINRNTSIIDSLYFGLWMDPDLGCYEDDFIGSAPELNSFFAYNKDSIDGIEPGFCESGVIPYHTGPPAIAATFLYPEMTSLMYAIDPAVGQHPPGMNLPITPLEFYRGLSGSWKDGSPLCEGGTGYIQGSDCIVTPYAFPGDPSLDSTWAMTNVMLPDIDVRMIGAAGIHRMDPGNVRSVHMAFSFHRDPSLSHLQNVSLMYNNLDSIWENFHGHATLGCGTPYGPCMDDCVWPGDVNNNGIVNGHDVLDLALALGKSGPARNRPLSWLPHPADPWTDSLPGGVNMKHADVNGNGTIVFDEDIVLLLDYYGFTHGGYEQTFTCNAGDEMIIQRVSSANNPSSFQSATSLRLNTELVDSLYGIAFTIRYDENLIRSLIPLGLPQPLFDEEVGSHFVRRTPGAHEHVFVRTDGQNQRLAVENSLTGFLIQFNHDNFIPGKHDTIELCIANARGILADGTEVPLGANTVQYIFLDENPTALSELKPQSISVYPNPSDGSLHFDVPSDLIGSQYEVRQMSGQLYSSNLITSEITQLVLPAGIYVLNIRSQEKQFVEKVVVLE